MRKAEAELIFQENLRSIRVLPPWVQEDIEKKAIKNDPRLVELIGIEEVIDIVKTEDGYIVITGTQRVEIKVKYLPIDYCGPAMFELEFGDVQPDFVLP